MELEQQVEAQNEPAFLLSLCQKDLNRRVFLILPALPTLDGAKPNKLIDMHKYNC